MTKLVAVNEKGARIGADHPRATLTDADIGLIFELREAGWGYKRIAKKMECSPSQIRRVVKGEQRAQLPSRYRADRG